MRFILLTLFICYYSQTFSQQKIEGSLLFGGAYYGGDLKENGVTLDYTYPCYGAALRYNINSSFAGKFQFTKGTIAGDDASTPNKDRGLYFKSDFLIVSLAAEVLPWRKNRFNNLGEFQKSFSPYFSAGVAMIQSADEVKTRNTTETQTLPEEGDKDVFIGFPFGAGIRWDLHQQYSIGLEGIWYATFSDYLDGISKYGNPGKKDWLMSATIYFSYFFGQPEPDFNFSSKRKF
jgi:hypothetical protein